MSVIASGSESYILCELANATYALRSDDIEQLDMIGQITPVPNAPGFVDGITSLRGRVIPVVNMRARFGFPRVAVDLRTRLVVVKAEGRSVGLVVDSAREFARIPTESIQPPPDGLAELSSQYLRGMAHLGERLVLVLDMAELLNITETPSIASTAILPALA
ncbi:MAG: chemotaxis protein CheW [Gemmatimonadaceae bacterium]